MQVGILEPDGFSKKAMSDLSEIADIECYDSCPLSLFLKSKDIIFIRLAYQIDADFLDKAPNLKILCSPTTAHSHIDEDQLESRGIALVSLRNEREFLNNIRATPEHTLGLMIAILRNYKDAFINLTNQNWDRDLYRGEELYGLNVGVIGMGRVGCKVSEYLDVFGSNVGYYDVNLDVIVEGYKKFRTLKELIISSDMILMSASYENNQSPILDSGLIELMKDKYFVNTARGELVDEESLIEAIRNGFLRGVATDVIASENNINNAHSWIELTERNNVIVTPHIAGATWTSMRTTEEFIVSKLLKILPEVV